MRNGARELLRKGRGGQTISAFHWSATCSAAIGWCGHCQLGPLLLCRDGPVVGYDVAEPLLRIREL